jgi:hypothetical protein
MTSPRNRLVSYGFVLVGLFGTAYAVGERLPGHEHSGADGHAHQHGTSDSTDMVGMRGTADPAGPDLAPLGLSSAVGDHRLVVVERTNTTVALRIDRAGVPVVDFTEVHGALGHLLVVRRDLQGFQHLHPVLGPDGVWTATLDRPIEPGAWRAVLETEPSGGSMLVLGVDLLVGGEAAPVAVPPPSNVATIDGLTVTRQGLWFTVTPSDSLQPWYGQAAHLVAFREGDLAYAHLHPANAVAGDYRFDGPLPGPGTYRLFLQFLAEGELVTAAFTVVEP